MLRGEVSPEAKAKAERAASAAGISLAWLLELLILNAPVDASGKMIDLPDREDLADQVRVRRTGRGPAAGQEELPLKTA
jgi:hypothetical protein